MSRTNSVNLQNRRHAAHSLCRFNLPCNISIIESGLQQALNATAVLFGDVDALQKLSGEENKLYTCHS